MRMGPCQYGWCGTRAVPTERFCEVHLLLSNWGRMSLGYFNDFLDYEMEMMEWRDI